MELSPHAVSSATFKTVKKGYDPDEVRSFLVDVAGSLESSQQQATAMEARARAAIAKLQELTAAAATAPSAPAEPASPEHIVVPPDEAETISRTLLLAQRTADLTVAEARTEAEALRSEAQAEAATVLEQAQSMAAKLLDEARIEARRTKDDEVQRAENEVQALLARRDFLLGDVDSLEHHVNAQRERLREASVALLDLVERVPGGLGEMRRPLLSASGGAGGSGGAGAPSSGRDTVIDAGARPAETPEEAAHAVEALADEESPVRRPSDDTPTDPTPISGVLPFAIDELEHERRDRREHPTASSDTSATDDTSVHRDGDERGDDRRAGATRGLVIGGEELR